MALCYVPPDGLQSPVRHRGYISSAPQVSGVAFPTQTIVPSIIGAPQAQPIRLFVGAPVVAGRTREPVETTLGAGSRIVSNHIKEGSVGGPVLAVDVRPSLPDADKVKCWPSGNRAAAASVTSTAPSDNATSAPSQPEVDHAPWSVDQTCYLCAARDKDQFLRRARLLDRGLGSVSTAVDRLNQGIVFCPEDFCIAYSASSQAYYLLYRHGCKDKAFAHFNLPEGLWCSVGEPTPTGVASARACLSGGGPNQPRELQTPRSQSLQDLALSLPDKAFRAVGSDALVDQAAGVTNDCARELVIGCHRFCLTRLIGQGAFGVVWKAFEASGSGEGCVAAVKVMEASTSEDLAMAVFEAELLRLLKTQLPQSSCEQVPQYISHSTTPQVSGGGTVNLAMSFIPGSVLDQWLYGISDEEHKQVDVAEIVRGCLPGSRMHSMSLAGACSFTGDLISQLAGVFAALQPIAFHRDISPHNVLIDIPNCATSPLGGAQDTTTKPSFALIDFGLAVRSDSWHRDWNESNLAGDPRYWMPPAWMAFAFGFECIEAHPNPSLCRQYLARIDHYGLGVLGLEMLFALWDIERRFDEQRAPGMVEAREAWCDFWEAMFGLFQMFHMRGPEVTRDYLEQSTHNSDLHIAELLKQVQQTLRIAEADPANGEYAPILHVLADLVDEHGVLEWSEIPSMLPASPGAGAENCSTAQGMQHNQHTGGEGPEREAAPPRVDDSRQHTRDRPEPAAELPQVTRYEVLSTARNGGGADRLSSTLQAVSPSVGQQGSRSPTQERGVHLFTQSLPPQFSVTAAPSPVPLQLASPASYAPPSTPTAAVERPRSYVPPATAGCAAAAVCLPPSMPVFAHACPPLPTQSASYVPPGAIRAPAGTQAYPLRVNVAGQSSGCTAMGSVCRGGP